MAKDHKVSTATASNCTSACDLNVPDLLEEFAELEKQAQANGATGAPGFAMEDVAKQRGVTMHYAQSLVAKLIDAGSVKCSGKQKRQNRVGGYKLVPVYLPVTK